MPKSTTGSTSIRLHGSTPGHIVKISEAGHLESVDMEEHGDFTALKVTVVANTSDIAINQSAITSGINSVNALTSRVDSNETELDTKQALLTTATNLNINDLSVGNTAITPGSTIQYPLLLEQTYVSGGAPQNGFGVGMKFRYSRGYNGGTLPSDQGAIESFFRAGAGSGAPYSGLRFTATDDNSTQELFQVYHTAPNDDGASTMDIGLNATGKLKAESIVLDGTDLSTTLDTKQSTISSSSYLTVAKLTFPSATAGNGVIQKNDTMSYLHNLRLSNCKLVGNDTLTSGSSGATIQNGNLINFSGLSLTGISTAREHVNTQVSNIVRGYGMWWFTHTHTDYDMNTLAGKSIRWTAKHVDTSLFVTGNPSIQVLQAGFYEISFTVFCTSGTQRPNPTIALFKNGTEFTSIAAHSYIRSADNHNNSTWTASPGIVQMAANDLFVVKGIYTGSGRQGNVYLVNGGGTSFTNVLGSVPIRPYMLIKRISD